MILKIKSHSLKVMLLSLASLVLTPAFADRGQKHPCHSDIQRFCKNIKPGGGAIIQCLRTHETELSQECRTKRTEMIEKHKAHREACKGDVEKFCKDVKPSRGSIRNCLKDHQSELSTGCSIPAGF